MEIELGYNEFYQAMRAVGLDAWAESLPARVDAALDPAQHGNLPAWLEVLAQLPALKPSSVDFSQARVRVGRAEDADPVLRAHLEAWLQRLHPWRKGPYELYGIHVDTEWRSDWKWARLRHAIAPLTGRVVLDVGCGNGYYAWRMLGAGAKLVVGVDPTLLSVMQFQALRRYLPGQPCSVLPLGIEDVPPGLRAFDSVFSMGVLYHRRCPLDHLLELRDCLRPGGQLVLETLVAEGGEGHSLLPPGRYAKMRNVWFIPSPPTLLTWLKRCGYRNPRVVDVTPTTPQEQRRTGWMRFESLADFLDPLNPALTVEGLPAPRRAIVLAEV